MSSLIRNLTKLLLPALLLLAVPASARAATVAGELLALINEARQDAGVPMVAVDELAATVAQAHAEEMLAGGYLSHWDRSGHKPSRRFNLAGGLHAVRENVDYSYHRPPLVGVHEIAWDIHHRLMNSPGHRKTILSPVATHVGIGVAVSSDGTAIYAAEEFVTRQLSGLSCPLAAPLGSEIEFSGSFDPGIYGFGQLVVAVEELPQPRTVSWLKQTSTYYEGQQAFAGYIPDRQVYFPGLETYHSVEYDARRGSFSARVLLDYDRQPGLYYLLLRLRRIADGELVLAAVATVAVE
jgi:hypothetical protein